MNIRPDPSIGHTTTGRWISVEFPAPVRPRPEISHVLFDFDGTLSIIREGWPELMAEFFLEIVPRLPGESEDQRRHLLMDDIARLTGLPTIVQMAQTAEIIRQRGGQPADPEEYKAAFLRRLDERTKPRLAGLADGSIRPDKLMIHGARPLLDHLRAKGLRLILASGTDEEAVRREVVLLKLADYFGPHIYGARADAKESSKERIIARILQDDGITGRQLLAFGDGFAEIEVTKQVGGLAVAVASDEAHNGSGRVDRWKRRRLLDVGADVVVPDYRDAIPLVDFLLNL